MTPPNSAKVGASSESAAITCIDCGATESRIWKGVRRGKPRCDTCYQRVRREARKRLPGRQVRKIFQMWGGE